MPGLSFSNELISRDKGLHCNFACIIYSKLTNNLHDSSIGEIISNAVDIELEFVVDALPAELIVMNSTMMCNYIKFCVDRLLLDLGCSRHYNTSNPSKWMETISLQGKKTSLKNVWENTPNPVWELTKPTKNLLSTLASDYLSPLLCLHVTHFFCSTLEHCFSFACPDIPI